MMVLSRHKRRFLLMSGPPTAAPSSRWGLEGVVKAAGEHHRQSPRIDDKSVAIEIGTFWVFFLVDGQGNKVK